MCVILVCQTERPDQAMVEKAWDFNDQGGGVGWIDGKSVRWKKGLNLEEMQDLCKTLPLPYIAHFRISSVGSQHPTLCHPFPIEKDVSTTLEGTTKKGVLFHNGTWTKWRETTFETLRLKNCEMPEGFWNDTRAIAFHSALYGINVLELIDERTAVVTPNGVEIFGSGWTKEGEVIVSNKLFLNQTRNVHHGGHFGTNLRERLNESKKGTGGSSSEDIPFLGSGNTVLPKEDIEESVQEASQSVSEGNVKGKGGERQTTPVKHPVDIALEVLREERLDLVVMGPSSKSAASTRGMYKTPSEAASEERRERQHRIDNARRGITYLGDM